LGDPDLPAWLYLSLLVSLLASLGYQIVRARSLSRVPLYWVVILAGFLAAEGAAESIHVHSLQLGELQIIPDLIGIAVAVTLLRLARL
jgi:hypothetical protein